ncbi:hypothetical protein B0J12DRAFT_77129 [Macrophomina phaseolina]|uniref:Uncharacterized protein n=1 Tax=Macrophomina phaseolina TaxID=35725 RepID=A0ABQ8GE07_9PEZI|nr:hypothetical protein B0J12DRAFT_77129 [Macrophomina phaseolina]
MVIAAAECTTAAATITTTNIRTTISSFTHQHHLHQFGTQETRAKSLGRSSQRSITPFHPGKKNQQAGSPHPRTVLRSHLIRTFCEYLHIRGARKGKARQYKAKERKSNKKGKQKEVERRHARLVRDLTSLIRGVCTYRHMHTYMQSTVHKIPSDLSTLVRCSATSEAPVRAARLYQSTGALFKSEKALSSRICPSVGDPSTLLRFTLSAPPQ